MKIGAHVSAAGGAWNAPLNASNLGLDTFQIFSRPPQGGPAPKIGPAEAKRFKAAMAEYGFTDFVIHAPYFTNLGSSKKNIYHGTVSVLKEELSRGSMLGASFVMFHPGSFKEIGQEKGLEQVAEGIGLVLKDYKGSTKLLVEISAGAGDIACDTFEELAFVLNKNKKFLGKTLGGVCFDTQHAFASGYDLRTPAAVEKTLKDFDKHIGLEYLKVLHVNDSKVDLGGRKDRHEHINEGYIKEAGFLALAQALKKRKINISWILETKHDKVVDDITKLQSVKKAAKIK